MECDNDIKSIRKTMKESFKFLASNPEDMLVCAEYTGRYIYSLTIACHDLNIFLWLDDPTHIKNSLGIVRGKNDAIDAARIAEYASRYEDKAVRYVMADKGLASLKSLLSDKEFLLRDRRRYQAQLSDHRKSICLPLISSTRKAAGQKFWKVYLNK